MNLVSPAVTMLWLSSFCVLLASFYLVYRAVFLYSLHIEEWDEIVFGLFSCKQCLLSVFQFLITSVFNYISLEIQHVFLNYLKFLLKVFFLWMFWLQKNIFRLEGIITEKVSEKKIMQIVRWNQLSTWYLKKEKTIICKMLYCGAENQL